MSDLGELGDKEFLVLTDQYSIEIFNCCLRLLPLYSSTFHQTNVESAQNRSEDNPLISRIQSLHLLLEVDHHNEEEYSVVLTLGNQSLEVDDHDEEEYSVVFTLGKRYANKFLALHLSRIFH